MAQASVVSLPAPVKGWNARDSLDGMPPQFASELTNFFPDGRSLKVRSGFTEHATGVGSGAVETVIEWHGPSTRKMLAAGGGDVYDATSAGTASAIGTSFSANDWQGVNFNGKLLLFNGSDAPQSYDGTTLSAASWTGTGLSASDLIQATVFNGRVYAVEKSGTVWYGGAGAITGAMTEFDVSQIAQGGAAQAVGSWSRDGGAGLDDYFVIVMSTGEILVYSGSFPGGSDWSKVGSYFGGEPIGRRCILRIGGELIVVTKRGYVPLSVLVRDGTADAFELHPVWGLIAPAVQDAAALYGSVDGWQAFLHPTGEAAYINVPLSSADSVQHVLNPITGAWTKYTNINARCFGALSGEMYFGTADGKVMKLTGTSDDGASIPYACRQAFFYPANRARIAQMTMMRPVISADGEVTATIAVDVDFARRELEASLVTLSSSSTGSFWDEDEWDVAEWSGGSVPISLWISAGGIGRAFAARFEGYLNGQEMEWFSTDFMLRPGGVK